MSPLPRDVTVTFDVPAEMRDGTILRANVYRPAGKTPMPTLLTRLPYDKNDPSIVAWLDPVQTARQGFLVVIQDTRGRFASGGTWSPFDFEPTDGFDSVEWAGHLPDSNGRVGMFGLSYFGNTQWAAAVERPRCLAAIAPGMTWSDPTDGLLSRGGALELGLGLPWMLEMGFDSLSRAGDESATEALVGDYDRLMEDGLWQLPVGDSEILRRYPFPELGGLRGSFDPSDGGWLGVAGKHRRVNVPTFHLGGWYDALLQGTLDNYSATAEMGIPSRLLVGPWTHATYEDPVGEGHFGLSSRRTGFPAHPDGDVNETQLAWFRRYLEDRDGNDEPDDGAPVRIFVMGRNQWRDESSWPPRAGLRRLYLGDDGRLLDDPPSGCPTTAFTYDPRDPVPTVGGNSEMGPFALAGPVDQRRIESRQDVCVFSSERIDRDLEVTGRVRVVLHAETSALSTDWVARLCDVHPDGRSVNICDGILRAVTTKGGIARREIDLWSTSNVFLAGHRLRVHISSSSFPRWDRNLNTGDQAQPRIEIARQRIHHGSDHASWIELPVIP